MGGALSEVADLLGARCARADPAGEARASGAVGDAGEGAGSRRGDEPGEFELKVAPVPKARKKRS